jgi:hypothetical protein
MDKKKAGKSKRWWAGAKLLELLFFGCMYYGAIGFIGYKTHWSVAVCLFLMDIANNRDIDIKIKRLL